MPEATILLVDDQPDLIDPVRRRLAAEGFDVHTAGNGLDALEWLERTRPDAIVLDVMMPRMDGLTTCRRIRQQWQVPILMLTAKGEETDVVAGLEMGADDYLTKPFRINELVARIRALLRRPAPRAGTAPEAAACPVQDGRLILNPDAAEVSVDGRPVSLTPVELRLLCELMRHAGKVLSRQALLEAVWGYDGYDLGLVNTHIKRLRNKIELDPGNPELIRTVRGFGYKLVP